MKIWVDADACPGVVKNILFKAADRTRVELTLVANHPMKIPQRNYITFLQVSFGFDEADNRILKLLGKGDLVITADIPLATQVLEKEGYALNPRGHLYSNESIQEQLRMREFKESLRNSGIDTGGPAAMNQKNTSKFAKHLNKLLNLSCV
ncbi:MAG: YaiI/YqxD family protein [Thermodesulfobacteriota bacterium]